MKRLVLSLILSLSVFGFAFTANSGQVYANGVTETSKVADPGGGGL